MSPLSESNRQTRGPVWHILMGCEKQWKSSSQSKGDPFVDIAFCTRISLESLGVQAIDETTTNSKSDSTEVFRLLSEHNLKKEDTRFQRMGF